MRRRPSTRPCSRSPFRPAVEGLESRALLSVTANNFSTNELQNTPGIVALRPFVVDTAATPVLSFSVGVPSQGGKINDLNAARGTFTYTPPSSTFVGTDTVSYTATDTTTKQSATATVSIVIGRVAAGRVGVPVLEGTKKAVDLGPDVEDVDSYATLTFSIPDATSAGGTITGINPTAGTFTYTPPSATFTGTDTLIYTVNDTSQGISSSASVVFDVAKLVADPDTVQVLQGTPQSVALGPALQDLNPSPTYSFSIPASSTQGGAVTAIDSAHGTFTYTPPSPTFTGVDTIVYSVTDTVTHATATGVMTLDVATLVADPVDVGVLEGTTRQVNLAPSAQDSNPGATLSFSLPSSTAQGGTVSDLDPENGSFLYTPPSTTFTGIDTLNYTVTDETTRVAASATVTLDVSALIADPAHVDVLQGSTKNVGLSADVEDIDADPTLSFSFPAKSAQGGTISDVDATQGTFTYATPAPRSPVPTQSATPSRTP